MLLWDSRTVHGGRIGEGLKNDEADQHQGLARLSFTVCMTQRSRASEMVLIKRRQAFDNGFPTSHWPHEYSKQSMGNYRLDVNSKKFAKAVETEAITDLI